jgi:hypothetical protein
MMIKIDSVKVSITDVQTVASGEHCSRTCVDGVCMNNELVNSAFLMH